MSDEFEVRELSSVQIDTTSKGFPTPRVKVVAGETEEEIERIKNLAVTAYQKTVAMLGATPVA